MDVTCSRCGKVRKYRPATIARLKTTLCQDCRLLAKQEARITLTCPHCGHQRTVKPSDAAKMVSETCFHCPRYTPSPLPDTYDAGYVLGTVLGDGSLAIQTRNRTYANADGTIDDYEAVGYTIRLNVIDRAFAEKFKHHLEVCLGRSAWMNEKAYVHDRRAKPEIGMPATSCATWVVIGCSREWWDKLKPFKKDRRFDGLLDYGELFHSGFIQGILDSEGYVRPGEYADIANKDLELLNLVRNVLASLGFDSKITGPYPYSRGVTHLRIGPRFTRTFTKTTMKTMPATDIV